MFQAASHAMSAAQGQTYYQNEYQPGDYYARDTGANGAGQWSGQLADQLGLYGAVREVDFSAVLEGRTGAGQEQVIPDPPKGAKGEHRAAWDFTCSPDKSVSVMALVGGDTAIVDDVREANSAALRELERYAMAKDSNRAFETTGNLVIASFLHDTSRRLDPQLHIHNVIQNMTRRSDGKLVALETREMYRAQALATAVFRAVLAQKLQARGYEVEIAKDGNVSIKGVSRELCDEFSKRRRQDIEPYLAAHGQEGAGAAQRAATSTRRAKQHDVDRDAIQGAWTALARERGANLEAVRAEPASRAHILSTDPLTRGDQALQSLHHAMEHLSERKAVFQGRELWIEALKHGMGKVTIEDLKAAAEHERDLIVVEEHGVPSGRMTTRRAIELERRNVALMREGQGAGFAILGGRQLETSKPLSEGQRAVAEHILTSTDQVLACEGKAGAGKTFTLAEVVTNAKRAGYEVRGFAPTSGAVKNLREIATTKRAHQTLTDVGLDVRTIAALEHAQDVSTNPRQLWIVDEAGLMSSTAARVVLERARAVGAKVVLIGDRLQHSAVEAGKPFAYLQDAGLQAVRLDEIQRQARPAQAIHRAAEAAQAGRWEEAARALAGRKGAPLPELEHAAQAIKDGRHHEAREILAARAEEARALETAVKEASQGRSAEAVAQLDQAGKVLELKDRAERHRAVAADYMRTPADQSCIVVAPSNAERRDLNRLIREELIKAGQVEKESHKAEIRVNKGLTRAELKDAKNYDVGDCVRFRTTSNKYGIERGAEARVLSIDRARNLVHIKSADGQRASFNPARYHAEVSSIDSRRFAVGDRIQYREPTQPEGAKLKGDGFRIANGDVGTIRSLDRDTGRAVVELEGSKRRVELDLSKAQPIDHAYALTSHAAQGRTVDRALLVIDTEHSRELVNRAQFYVGASRAALEARVYTNDKAQLAQAVSREAGKSSALELFGKTQAQIQEVIPHGSRSEPRREPAHEAAQQQAAGQRYDRHHERNHHGRGAATLAGRPIVSLDVLPGAQFRTQRDLVARPAVARGDRAANQPASQYDARVEALRRISPAAGRAESRTRETDNGFDRSQEAARRLSPKIDYGDALREGRGRETSRLRDPASRTSTSHAQGSSRDGDRNRAGIQHADHGIDASRGNQVSRDRTEPAQYAGTHHGPGEMGTPDSRPPATARRDAPAQVASVQVSAWDRLSEQAQALKNNIQDRTTTPATEATVSTNATRQTPESRVAYARAHALEQQLATTEKQFETAQGWQQREQLGKQVEGLREQHYEATQDARMDIDQRRIQELKTEHQALEHLKTTEATSYQQRAPLEQRQEAIKNEIYTLRHGERSELGNLSRQLGREEHHLHAAHRTLNSAAKRHPEALGRMKSPATRDAVNNMSNPELQAFARNMHDAARHAQSASRLLDKPPQEQAALKHHLDQAKVSHEAAQRAVDRDRGYSLSH